MRSITNGRSPDYRMWYLLLVHLILALLCDFSATIYSALIPTPLSLPDLGTIAGFLWFVFSLLILRAIIKHFSNGSIPRLADILSYMFTFGYGVYMVGNSVQAKLWLLKYKDELAHVTSYPGVDSKLLPVFKLLYFYDEYLGHFLIYIPYFLLFVIVYACALGVHVQPEAGTSTVDETAYPWWMFVVIVLTSMYFAWNAIEGQSILRFSIISGMLLVVKVYYRFKGFVPGAFGKTVEAFFAVSFVWIFLWWAFVGHFKEMPQVLETLQRALMPS
jgi:hypothetical protein